MMQRAFRITSIALLLGSFAAAPEAAADELIEVAAHRAAPPGIAGDQTPPLLGFLARPPGAGRFPAVVLLHGCSGFTEHETAAAATLRSWGYVALAIDSFGDANLCGNAGGSFAEASDAHAALTYLAAQSFVASDRVAAMGYSMGGSATLEAIERRRLREFPTPRFRAGVAYYPTCEGVTGNLTVPALILVGEKDDWTPAVPCRKLAAHESDIGVTRKPGVSAPIDLVVYPGVTHAFDLDFPPHRYLGHVIRPDAAATHDAESRVRAFLRDNLGDQVERP